MNPSQTERPKFPYPAQADCCSDPVPRQEGPGVAHALAAQHSIPTHSQKSLGSQLQLEGAETVPPTKRAQDPDPSYSWPGGRTLPFTRMAQGSIPSPGCSAQKPQSIPERSGFPPQAQDTWFKDPGPCQEVLGSHPWLGPTCMANLSVVKRA